jgi:GST-like protein
MIDCYYWPTPNGKKVTILLEELGIDYQIVPCDIGRGDQFSDGFLDISPNNRMPAMVDHDPVGGGDSIAIFESGAMMMYIAEKEGRFFPQDPATKAEVTQWVMNVGISGDWAIVRAISLTRCAVSLMKQTGSTAL